MKIQRSAVRTWFFVLAVVLCYQTAIITAAGLPWEFAVANFAFTVGSAILVVAGARSGVSIHQSIMVFFLIFFGIVPPLQLAGGFVFWGASRDVLLYYGTAMLVALGGIVVFQISYIFSSKRLLRMKPGPVAGQKSPPNSYTLLALSGAAAFAILAVNNFSLQSLFVRGGEYKDLAIQGQTGHLVYQFAVFPVPCAALILHLVSTRRRSLITALLILLFLMTNPITGMARFQAAAMYTAVLLAFWPKLLGSRVFLPAIYIAGVLLILPLLNIFRRFSGFGGDYELALSFLGNADFDSFQSLANAISVGTVSWGAQLLGALLFFVPRSVWPDKPIGTGADLAIEQNFYWTNISMNFMGEGFLNFHYPGVILFMLVLGWIAGQLDFRFWTRRYATARTDAQYLLLIGLFFFIMRGDLMSSFAFASGMMFTTWLLSFIATKRLSLSARKALRPT